MRILLLSAEPTMTEGDRDSVASVLRDLGCRVTCGRFDLGGLGEVDGPPPELIVVDAGIEIMRANRCRVQIGKSEDLAETPTLLAVAVSQLAAVDFSVGFDDFVLLPVVPAELYARLRQLDWKTATFGSEEAIKFGDLVIDLAGYEAHLRGKRLTFTHQEFELLQFLAQNVGRVFTRDQLLQRVWGYEYTGGTRTVDIHVRRIRSKLGPVASVMIQTIRNVGYKFRMPTANPEAVCD